MVWLTWLWPNLLGATHVVQPETILRWDVENFVTLLHSRHSVAGWLTAMLLGCLMVFVAVGG